jgi:hypothetical protein
MLGGRLMVMFSGKIMMAIMLDRGGSGLWCVAEIEVLSWAMLGS